MDYAAPPRTGLVRLRPGSGGTVAGDGLEKDFNKHVMSDLDSELSSELALVHSGKPLGTKQVEQMAIQEAPLLKPKPAAPAGTAVVPEERPALGLLYGLADKDRESKAWTGLTILKASTLVPKATEDGTGAGTNAVAAPPDGLKPLINRGGFRLPSSSFVVYCKDRDVTEEWTTSQLFNGNKCVIFGIVNAFQPTCTVKQLPRYNELVDSFKSSGVSAVYCVGVHDTHVMNHWQEATGAFNVVMLPDGCGHFTRGIGMMTDRTHQGMGFRSHRYSMFVDNCVIVKMFIEPLSGDKFEVSDADTMLNYINPNAKRPHFVALYGRERCFNTKRAKDLLNAKGWGFEEFTITKDFTRNTLHAVAGNVTTPQIFIDGRYIGGFDELDRFFRLMG